MLPQEALEKLISWSGDLGAEWLKLFAQAFPRGSLSTLVPMLPTALSIRGKPFTLDRHFPFEPLFGTQVPPRIVVRAGRQVGKSVSLAARCVVMSATIPNFHTLYIAPLKEQSTRFSSDRVRPLIEGSPIRPLLRQDKRTGSVQRRAFQNEAVIYFLYALLDAERVRGVDSDLNLIDESQDLDPAHMPVINECLSASEYAMTMFAGTSKTRDTTLEKQWSESSQAHWVTRCGACRHHNIASVEFDLLKMIGPLRDDISLDNPATICAKCSRPIRPHEGRWEHRRPERASYFIGLHMPQVIFSQHYSNPEKWRTLLAKGRGMNNYSWPKYLNEVLGEPSDESIKLVSKSDLERAGVMHKNHEETARSLLNHYTMRVLAVDWGGDGDDRVSLTSMAVLGIRPDGRIDVIFGKKLANPGDHLGEAQEARRLFHAFQCHLFVHDFGGAGALRETFMIQAGVPPARIIPVSYTSPFVRKLIGYHPGDEDNPKTYWSVDKTRSLQLTAYGIKLGKVFFFKYEEIPDEPSVLEDFLALIENNIPTARGGNVYTIQSSATASDDFAQAVNIGCMVLWNSTGSWPDFAKYLVGDRGSAAPGG
jgi:hypothetical protein